MKYSIGLLCLFLLVCVQGHGHDHDHGHSHDEPPSFKYSRAANEAEDPIIEEDLILEEDIVDVPPGFSKEKPTHNHGHNHGGHGHSHGGHGHSHGGHGHSHGGHGHNHGGHGHSHGRHGHSHGGHSHSHGGHGHSHGPPQREPTPEERERLRKKLHQVWDDDDEEEGHSGKTFNLWFYALGSTLAISLAPFAILFFFTLDNSEEQQGKLKVLLSFASGGLLGDAFLHLIPHAIMAQEGHGHSHGDHGHSHGGSHGHSHGDGGEGHGHDLTVGLGVLGGILAFLVVEKIVRIYSEGGHGHSHGVTKKDDKKEDSKKKEDKKKKDKKSDDEDEKKDDKKKEKEDKKTEKSEEVRVAGYLNLFADFFHNFTDGLAIGASFLAGRSVGLVTTFTILFHEIPHEIGDYAILIQSGVKPFRAKCLQLLTALGAFTGCVVSLLAEGVGDAVTAFILPFTAGGFIYIATVSVIPELLDGSTTFKQSIMEILALLAGVYMMVIIAEYE